MVIYNPNGTIFLDIAATDNSYCNYSIMSDHNVVAYFESPEPVKITVGCYINFQGIRYAVRRASDIIKNGVRNLEYTVIFESPQADSYKRTVRNPSDKRLKFPYTATPKEHAELIVWNLNQISNSGWSVGECIEAPHALISYNHSKCWDAAKTIANTFNTEFEFDCLNNIFHVRRVEYNKDSPLNLAYGRGNGFKPGIGRRNVDSSVPVEILAVQGGTRNIDPSKYDNNTDLLLPKGQTISFDGSKFEDEEGFDASNARRYIVDAEGLTISRADKELSTYEDSSVDLSNIYPMREGTVTGIEVTDDGNYNIIDNTIPEELNYADYRIAGEEAVMIFQKSQMLAGREFRIMQDKDRMTGYNHSQRKFMLVSDEQDGQTMPNDVFAPQIGDTYAIFGIMLPDAYIRDDATKSGASWTMFREAVKVLFEEEQAKFSFTCELDGKWARDNWSIVGGRIGIGHYIRFTDDQMIGNAEDSVLIRITGKRTPLNRPQYPQITLANVTASTYNDDFRKITENEVVVEDLNKSAVNFTKRSFRDAQQTMLMLQDALLNFSEGINPITVQTMQMLVGDEQLQFKFVASKDNPVIDPNWSINYIEDTKQLEIEPTILQHMTHGINNISSSHASSEYKFWDMEEYISPYLGGENASKKFYLYAKCADDYADNTFLLSETAIALDWGSDYYYLLVGILNSEFNGTRSFVSLYGFTEVLPGQIRTDKIVSSDGYNFIDLVRNAMRLGNDANFIDWNNTESGKLLIKGLLKVLGEAQLAGWKLTNEAIKSQDGRIVLSGGADNAGGINFFSPSGKGVGGIYNIGNAFTIITEHDTFEDGSGSSTRIDPNGVQIQTDKVTMRMSKRPNGNEVLEFSSIAGTASFTVEMGSNANELWIIPKGMPIHQGTPPPKTYPKGMMYYDSLNKKIDIINS